MKSMGLALADFEKQFFALNCMLVLGLVFRRFNLYYGTIELQ